MATGGKDTNAEFIAIDGIVATGTYGVALAPTNSSTPLGATWEDLGLTTAAGVTRSEPRSATVRRAWQNNQKIRTLVTDASVKFVFVLIQTTQKNVELFHGVPLVAGSLVTNPNRDWPLIAFNFDTIDGANVIREYAPRARVTEIGDRVAVAGDTFGWPITIEAEYDSTLGGFTKPFYSKFEGAVPTITTAGPASKGAGDIVKLDGTGLLAVTAVTVGGVAAASFDSPNDLELYLTLPAGSAGSAPIIVTSPIGPSVAKAYTRIV